MKILFIIQGEGRGHLTQAITLESILRRNGHDVVEVLVGQSDSRRLPGFFNRNIKAPVKRFQSPNFLPTSANRRVSLVRSVGYNLLRLPAYVRSMYYINRRIRETGAELVINFYELLTGLTYFFFRPSVTQLCIGHQYLFLHPQFRFPEKSKRELFILRFFTRMTGIGACRRLALSFHPMDDDPVSRIRVIPPLLRPEVLACESEKGDYLHGYLLNSGFAEDVLGWHRCHPQVPLHFFWDKPGEEETCYMDDTLTFHQIDDMKFLRYMSGCRAYATTAGFESVCEAMYLGKPLLMVPAHIEQDCNAYDAALAGAGIVADSFDLQRLLDFEHNYRPNVEFRYWVRSSERIILEALEEAVHSGRFPLGVPYECCNGFEI